MLLNSLWLALRSIRRNPLRSFLTMLGIVIGVSAVITMVTIGNGATQAVRAQIESLGSNLLMVRPGQRMGPMRGPGAVGAPWFREADAEAIAEQIGGVRVVAPEARSGATVVAAGRNWNTSVIGSTNDYFSAANWALTAGRIFTEEELLAGSSVCVIGETLRRELFGGGDVLGERIRVRQFTCLVIGVLAAKGQAAMGGDQDDLMIMPLRTVQRRVTGNQTFPTLLVSMQPGSDVERIKASLTQLLRERRKLSPAEDDNFNVLDTAELADTITGTTRVMTALLGAVAAVSLLVGGIGIMNIMLVSVTERTREIGLRLAVGAFGRDVLLQFLIEAVVLAALGGTLGILLATGASMMLAGVLQLPYIFSLGINLLAFVFSAAIGVLFGYFPALRAARLDPIEALRHE